MMIFSGMISLEPRLRDPATNSFSELFHVNRTPGRALAGRFIL